MNHESLGRSEVQEYLTFWFDNAADYADYAESGGLVPTTADVYEANVQALETSMGDTPSGTPSAPQNGV